LFIKY